MKRIRNIPIETALVLVAMCISLIGFIITITGAFLNGWGLFNGSIDSSKKFGIIMMGVSIGFLGVVIILIVIIVNIFRWYCVKPEVGKE